MNTIVSKVPLNKVHQTWPLVEKFFADVEPHMHEEMSLSQMKLRINMGDWALIVFTKGDEIIGAIGMFYQNRPNHRVAFIVALGGKNITTEENWVQLKEIFKKDGATAIEAAMRNSTFRLWERLGFTEKYRIAGYAL